MQIFTRDVVGMPAFQAWLVRPIVAVVPKMRHLALRQLYDLDGVGSRLSTYGQIKVPTVLLGGDRSPANLGEALDWLAAAMPNAEKVVLTGRDHMAHRKEPTEVGNVIQCLADRVLGQPTKP
jgi:pimeloyl-ACP methyl ester carboxylesterase